MANFANVPINGFQYTGRGTYILSDIYNPDIHGTTIEGTGKIVPQLGSLVTDDTPPGLRNQLYVVIAVDETTKKSTLRPVALVDIVDGAGDRILSYGNDIYMLYYSTVTITDNTGTITRMTKLIIDDKLALFGNHSANYQLVRTNLDGSKTIVSQHFGTNNTPMGPLVPISETPIQGVRKCNSCYSYANFTDGEIIALDIYDAVGIHIATIQLNTRKALILNELAEGANPIVKFDIKANQMIDDDIIVYVNQNKDEIAFYPELTYADGTTQVVAIDGVSGLLYGWEDVSTQYPEVESLILAKYYIPDDVPSNISEGEGVRYVACEKRVRIVNSTKYAISKIAPIPVWNSALSAWSLYLNAYKQHRTGMSQITNATTITGFNGTVLNTKQIVTLSTTQTPDSGVTETYTQQFALELRNPTANPNWFLMSDDIVNPSPSPAYGNNTPPYVAPVILYGSITTSDNTTVTTYYIPESRYAATQAQSKEDVFLMNFYDNAQPPRLSNESQAPRPTHYTIRAATNGVVLLTAPRAITNFGAPLFLNANLNQYVGSTLVVEFWRKVDDTTYETLYGVPVPVKSA